MVVIGAQRETVHGRIKRLELAKTVRFECLRDNRDDSVTSCKIVSAIDFRIRFYGDQIVFVRITFTALLRYKLQLFFSRRKQLSTRTVNDFNLKYVALRSDTLAKRRHHVVVKLYGNFPLNSWLPADNVIVALTWRIRNPHGHPLKRVRKSRHGTTAKKHVLRNPFNYYSLAFSCIILRNVTPRRTFLYLHTHDTVSSH